MTVTHSLSLRQTKIGGDLLPDDFEVWRDGYRIGRIRLAVERSGLSPGWDWHINPPLPNSAGNGTAPNFEDAKTAFKAAWERFYETLTPDDIEHWHRTADGADRFGR
jgi:hypothetical protein